jgi:hypothetical protein
MNHLGQAVRIPDWMADASLSYYADIFRSVLDHLGTPGRRDSKSLVVQPAGGMNIQVTAGTALVAGTDRGGVDATGITLQGSYIVRVDATVGPVSIAAAPGSGSRTDRVYLVVSDKTEQSGGTNDAYVQVLASTATAPKSSLVLASITVAAGTASITAGMITAGVRSTPPALADPSFGYVDKTTTDTAGAVAAKRFAKLALGSAPDALGTNISAGVLPTGGQSIPSGAWTSLNFNNSSTSQYIDYRDANIEDDGTVIHAAGFIPLDVGWYRISACVAMPTSTAGSQRGLRAVSQGGRVIACVTSPPANVSDNNPLTISQTFYWKYANLTTDPILIQVYHNCGSTQRIGGQYTNSAGAADMHQPQTAVLERLT